MIGADRGGSAGQLLAGGRPDEAPPPACPAGDHQLGIGLRPIVGLLAFFALYAAALAVVARGAESTWGAFAAGAYGAAALVALRSWRRHPGVPLLVALAGAVALPASVLPSNLGATDEVRVVARAASLWLAHGTPYLASGQLVSWRSYDPYLPAMSLFGLPRALGLGGPLGDPLIWQAVLTAALVAGACRIAARGAAGRCRGCRRQALLRSLLLLSCPLFALPMSLGVTDPPVIALICLALALAGPGDPAGPARGEPAAGGGLPGAGAGEGGPSRPVLAGIAVGAACALKATAWPVLPVIFVLIAVRHGRRTANRFAGWALGSALALLALTAPALLVRPGALWQNLVAYPLGLSRRQTPAASPLPGHLLASAGSLGHLAAIALLVSSALAVGASLLRRPPEDLRQATVRLSIGFTALFVLAPDARFGYFAYPLGILSWLILTIVLARRPMQRPAGRSLWRSA